MDAPVPELATDTRSLLLFLFVTVGLGGGAAFRGRLRGECPAIDRCQEYAEGQLFGPYANGAKWDLTQATAEALDFESTGAGDIRVAKLAKRG